MKNLITALLVTLTGMAFSAHAEELPNLDGTYIYDGNPEGNILNPWEKDIISFPSRNLEERGSEVEIYKNTEFTIRTTKTGYVFTHLPVTNMQPDPENRGPVQTLVSFEDIKNQDNTKAKIVENGFQIKIKHRAGLGLVGGENINVTVTKNSQGDILVADKRTGWALLPAPLPIHDDIVYVFKRIK